MIYVFAAVLTIFTETIFWSCFKAFRKMEFLIWCGIVNLLSNVGLNMVLQEIMRPGDGLLSVKVLTGECLVVLYEFFFLIHASKESKWKIFLLTLSANIITLSISFFI